MADGPGGAVVWQLGGTPLDPKQLGVDSGRATRVLPPAGRSVLAVALSLEGGCRMACAHEDGSASVYALESGSEEGEAEGEDGGAAWRMSHSCRLGTATSAARGRGAWLRGKPAVGSAQVRLRGEWLTMVTPWGELATWRCAGAV
mmetsp:Transcript_23009/g.53270  ORF Transcript_23009/g.53270 Transcript_23009/m.53270 type:complete len:145 (+) Transcript_23009:266-700(+)